MNLAEWSRAQGIHVSTAYRWWREGTLPVLARKLGRLILVAPDTAADLTGQDGAGLYARVSPHDQKADLDRQVARLSAWATAPGVPVVRIEAGVGSGVSGTWAKARRLLADPRVTGGLAGDMTGVLAWLCARLYGRRSARNRASKAAGCAQQDIGPQALAGTGAAPCGGAR